MSKIKVSEDMARLTVRTRMYGPILEALPMSRAISHDAATGEAEIELPWDYYHAEKLAIMGAPSISPIARDYYFPSKYPNPFHWQLKIANFFTLNPRAFCFADMGLGKTLAAIWAADYLMSIGVIRRVLVVCPTTIMEAAWGADLFSSITKVPYEVLHASSRDRRIKLAMTGVPWHIINYEGVELIHNELQFNRYDLIIADESTKIKNPDANRSKALRSLSRPDMRIWALTGTPVPQGPMDAYGQIKLLRPELITESKTGFQNRTMTKVTKFKWVPRHGWRDQVFALMQPAIRFKKSDCLKDLPPVTPIHRKVELTAEQRRMVESLRKNGKAQLEGFEITASHAAAEMNKLVQIFTGAVYTDDGSAVMVDARPRLAEMDELIDQARQQDTGDSIGGKFLIFVPYRHVAEVVVNHLRERGLKVEPITSEVSPAARGRILKTFNTNNDLDGIVAIPSTMSHGVTATAACLTVWYGAIDANEVYMQANNRMDRPGQKQNMIIAHLYANEVERRMYENLRTLGSGQEALLSLYYEFLEGL